MSDFTVRGDPSAAGQPGGAWATIVISRAAVEGPPNPVEHAGALTASCLIGGFIPAVPAEFAVRRGDEETLTLAELDQYRARQAERGPQIIWEAAIRAATRRVRPETLIQRWWTTAALDPNEELGAEVTSVADQAGLSADAIISVMVSSDPYLVRTYPRGCVCLNCLDAIQEGPVAALLAGAPAVAMLTGAEPA